jgi:hypothetical protein
MMAVGTEGAALPPASPEDWGRGHPPPVNQQGRMMSMLYAGFLVIASLFAMAALGMLILVAITEVSRLTTPTNSPGMNR